jgi:hypothetical protein
MNNATVTVPKRTSPSTSARRRGRPYASDESRALWAMSRSERIEAMWRSELTIRQLTQWSSRAPHEVPLLGGEFAWIAMRTPEWAEATNEPDVDLVLARHQEVNR